MFIQFKPLLKTTLWGGDKIIPFKHLQSDEQQVGESWEISGVKGSETVVSGGPYDGCKLNDVLAEMKGRLVGEEKYRRSGNEFPLLVKFIDARQDLSIQVHPDDETAARQGKGHGKSEMWYIMDSAPDAKLYCGLNRKITPEQYEKMVADDTITNALAQYMVKEGDVFFLPAGRIHSICAGCFLVEIQQTSDVTYRIYDYKRKDKNGNYRELHTREAAESIHYHVERDYRTDYVARRNQGVTLVQCPHFCTALYDLDEPMTLDYSELDSLVILICLNGSGTLTDDEGNTVTFQTGDTILAPATTQTIQVEGTVRFLETYV